MGPTTSRAALATIALFAVVVGGRTAAAQDDDSEPEPRVVQLTPGTLEDPTRLPLHATPTFGDELPSDLTWGDYPVRRKDGNLEIATRSPTRFDQKIRAGRARLLRFGSRAWPRHLMVFDDNGTWRVAYAATLAGGRADSYVELLDADGDGTLGGADDLIRTGSGPFLRQSDARRVWATGAICTYRLVKDGTEHRIELSPEPVPDWAEPQVVVGWRTLNTWRNRFGLAPQRLSRDRVEACALHHEYWVQNGYTAHDETPGNPGYTQKGAFAGKRSSVWHTGDVERLVNRIASEVLHRRSLLAAATEGLGFVEGTHGSMAYGGRLGVRAPRAAIVVPGRGQRMVPTHVDPESPAPESNPDFYATEHGYPVGVYYPGGSGALKDVTLTVTPHGQTEALAGTLFTEKAPCHSRYPGPEAVFVADLPLEPETWFRAHFAARDAEGPFEISWWFSTGGTPFPGMKKR